MTHEAPAVCERELLPCPFPTFVIFASRCQRQDLI